MLCAGDIARAVAVSVGRLTDTVFVCYCPREIAACDAMGGHKSLTADLVLIGDPDRGRRGALLRKHPEFADRCQWERLSGWNWRDLLKKQPMFADRCDWKKLSGEDWDDLLGYQPQFADKRPPEQTE